MARSPAFNTITRAAAVDADAIAVAAPYDALANPSNDDLVAAALSFWPQGSAWGSPNGQAVSLSSGLAKFSRVLLDGFVWLYARAFRLSLEASVRGVDELLPDWEADYGLPEGCFVGDLSTAQRLSELARKVKADAINHPEQFVRVALDHGFEIEIEEPAIFECGFSEVAGFHAPGPAYEETYWIVRVKDAGLTYFEAGASECGYDPLFSFGAAEQILCLLRKLAPAWTLPILAPWIYLDTLVTEDGTPIVDEYGNEILVTLNN
ncbi:MULTISPECIES: putative phage tail protein [unclassified Rhizobium]|uniref:putative phage tail protein n=1 Tax=unclassified Rhizobium TaxID=2613769 RepID=UPI000B531265|nr:MULTISPECIES: putative phage tail protein [unclassified Rhizobium]